MKKTLSLLVAVGAATASYALYPTGDGGASRIFDNLVDPGQTTALYNQQVDYFGPAGSTHTSWSEGVDVDRATSFKAFTNTNGNTLKSYSYTKGADWGKMDVTTEGQSYFDDNLTIDAPGMTGQFGYMTGSVTVDGLFTTHSVAGGKNARARLIVYQYYEGPDNGYSEYPNGTFTAIDDHRFTGDGLGDVTEAVSDVVNYSFHFQYGTEFHIGMNVLARTRIFGEAGQAEAWAESDFSHSLNWGGAPTITTDSGQTVSDFSIKAASGLDRLNPAPEPASFLALGLGIAGIAKRKRRRA